MARKTTFGSVIFMVIVILLSLPVMAQGSLSVIVREVRVDGGFAEVSDVTQQLVAPFKGRRTTVEELQALAHAVELIYHEAGYFLVRVTIPPQEVMDGDAFFLRVIDGYLEAIDLHGVPERVRPHLETLLNPIVNKKHLQFDEYERHVMLARQTPGLSIQTTLVPGEGTGAALLVVDGVWSRFGGTASLKTHLTEDTAPWNSSVKVQLNQPLGRGEQVTANLSGPATTLLSSFRSDEISRTFGGAVKWPLGNDGKTLHVNYNESRTYTPSPHWIIPATRTEFRRTSLELSHPLRLARTDELRVSLTLDETEQTMEAPDFQAMLYHDRLRVIRVGADIRRETPLGSRVSTSLQFSQGLNWGSRSAKDVQQSGIPVSRPGASWTFQKVTLTASERFPFDSGWSLTSTLRAQFVVSGPLPSTELFGLNGENALPSLALGTGSNDVGWTLREEIEKPLSLQNPHWQLSLYGYAAIGRTEGEMMGMSDFASALGIGARGDVGPVRLSLEYGRGRTRSASDDALVGSVEVAF